MRMLGIDYGDARIGLSVCDELEIMATPLRTIKSESMKKNIDTISIIVKEERVEKIIVGLPLNMDGSEGERAQKSRAFGRVLERVAGVVVDYQDERLTTMQAEEIMNEMNIKKNKRQNIVDTISAQIILESYLKKNKK